VPCKYVCQYTKNQQPCYFTKWMTCHANQTDACDQISISVLSDISPLTSRSLSPILSSRSIRQRTSCNVEQLNKVLPLLTPTNSPLGGVGRKCAAIRIESIEWDPPRAGRIALLLAQTFLGYKKQTIFAIDINFVREHHHTSCLRTN
jgi:hypothetical protein